MATLLDIDFDDAAAAMRAFLAWAGSEQDLKVLFTPDVLLAVDRPDRRGYLVDEVHFVTIWVDRGAPELRACLDRAIDDGGGGGGGGDRPRWTEQPAPDEPRPAEVLATALARGRPLPEVRHLL